MLTELAIPYADTSAAALQWSAALPGVAPLDVLVLTSPRGGVALELRLLGASHCAVLDTGAGTGTLVETVAGPAYGGAGVPLPGDLERAVGPVRYRFTSRIDRLDPDALAALAAGLRAGVAGRDDRLAGAFPGARDALTVLHGAVAPGQARWRTWHLYPNTGEAVLTMTAVRW